MHLDQVVNVHCTDTDKENKGRVVRMHPKGIDVELNDIIFFRGNHYHLRAINNYNLKTGECALQLLGPILDDALDNQ